MAIPERFSNLPEYAFPRLRGLLDAHKAGGDPITMTIGEPRHPMPDFVGSIMAQSLASFGNIQPMMAAPSCWPRFAHGLRGGLVLCLWKIKSWY